MLSKLFSLVARPAVRLPALPPPHVPLPPSAPPIGFNEAALGILVWPEKRAFELCCKKRAAQAAAPWNKTFTDHIVYSHRVQLDVLPTQFATPGRPAMLRHGPCSVVVARRLRTLTLSRKGTGGPWLSVTVTSDDLPHGRAGAARDRLLRQLAGQQLQAQLGRLQAQRRRVPPPLPDAPFILCPPGGRPSASLSIGTASSKETSWQPPIGPTNS